MHNIQWADIVKGEKCPEADIAECEGRNLWAQTVSICRALDRCHDLLDGLFGVDGQNDIPEPKGLRAGITDTESRVAELERRLKILADAVGRL